MILFLAVLKLFLDQAYRFLPRVYSFDFTGIDSRVFLELPDDLRLLALPLLDFLISIFSLDSLILLACFIFRALSFAFCFSFSVFSEYFLDLIQLSFMPSDSGIADC